MSSENGSHDVGIQLSAVFIIAQITESTWIRIGSVIFALALGCGRAAEGESLLARECAVAGARDCTLELLAPERGIRAREFTQLRWRARSCAQLGPSLRLVTDMPAMSHGPTTIELEREGDFYEGELLFVMGGRWELRLFEGERELLVGWLDVAER